MERLFSIAKNYLNGVELEDMGKLVNSVLDMAERMADRHIPMTMEDWAKRIDKFLDATDREILQDAGHVSAEYAKEYAKEYAAKEKAVSVRNLMENMKLTLEQALNALGIQGDERTFITKQLQK